MPTENAIMNQMERMKMKMNIEMKMCFDYCLGLQHEEIC